MALQGIKKEVQFRIEELFATAALDEMAGHTEDYQEKLKQIMKIADILGIKTEFTTLTLNLKEEVQ